MDNSKTILREGYVYREEKLHGQADVLYCVLKPNTLSFHRRKVHKRHTPLGLFKLEELSVDIEEGENDEVDSLDCNHNVKRFLWTIISGGDQVFLYCASLADRNAWVDSIEGAKKTLSCAENPEDFEDDVRADYNCINEGVKEQCKLVSGFCKSDDSHQLLSHKSVDNSTHSANKEEASVRKQENSQEYKMITRVRSRSLSEMEKPNKLLSDKEQHARSIKSKSAPPDGGKRGYKTVDKLIDVHSGLCRQLVRWIWKETFLKFSEAKQTYVLVWYIGFS